MIDIRERVQCLLSSLSQGAYEREEAISLALLASVAGESIFLLGLPGVGKSMIARRLKLAFNKANCFEYLMSRFSTPDEIFGPVSISKLKDEDIYERMVEGYLPTADIIFLDEIWKAGPAIQNALLTVLNEKIFRNGKQDLHLPIKAIISASNELPAEGEGLEALWDRFLIRYVVDPIQARQSFLKLITEEAENCEIPSSLQFSNDELKMMSIQISKIIVPDIICQIICDIREGLSQARSDNSSSDNVPYVSDRRWRKIIHILKTSAFMNGRMEIDSSDCLLLEHLIWDNDGQITSVREMIANVIVNNLTRRFSHEILNESNTERLTKPVGELSSPNGKHYIFKAGGEEVCISKELYNSLTDEIFMCEITQDNELIHSAKGSMAVSKRENGDIILNTFIYPMVRDTPLRSGSVQELRKRIAQPHHNIESGLKYLIDDNLFLRPSYNYDELSKAFQESRKKM